MLFTLHNTSCYLFYPYFTHMFVHYECDLDRFISIEGTCNADVHIPQAVKSFTVVTIQHIFIPQNMHYVVVMLEVCCEYNSDVMNTHVIRDVLLHVLVIQND